jgi:hypothetical protein
MPPFTRENKPTADKTIPQEEIFGVDREEMQFVNGVSSPGWVRRREIGNGRVVHETLVSMVTPPGDQGGADDDFFPNDPSRVLINDLSALGVDVVSDYVATKGVRADEDGLVSAWNDSRVNRQDGALVKLGTMGSQASGGGGTEFVPWDDHFADKSGYSCVVEGFFSILTYSYDTIHEMFGYNEVSEDYLGFGLYRESDAITVYWFNGVYYSAYTSDTGELDVNRPFRVGATSTPSGPRVWLSQYDIASNLWEAPREVAVEFFKGSPWGDVYSMASIPDGDYCIVTASMKDIEKTQERVWAAALTPEQMLVEVAGGWPTIAPAFFYTFADPSPYENLGTVAGADYAVAGRLDVTTTSTIGSSDYRYRSLVSRGTNRPSAQLAGGTPVVRFDDISQSLRAESDLVLGDITDDAMLAVICAPDAAGVAVDLTNVASRVLGLTLESGATTAQARVNASTGASVSTTPSAMQVLFSARTSAGSAPVLARNGLGTEVASSAQTPSASTPNRLTIGASGADALSNFAGLKVFRLMLIKNVADPAVREQAQTLIYQYAQQFAGVAE